MHMKIHHGLTKDIWPVMILACRNATKSIWFEQYLMGTGETPQAFVDILCQKASEGVEVRCLFDALGSFAFGRSSLHSQLLNAGAKVNFFNWLKPFSNHNKKFIYFRNHRRLLILDGISAFTGGICIDDATAYWQDTQVEVTGPVVEKMKDVFNRDWYSSERVGLKLSRKKSPYGAEGFYFFTSDPLPHKRYLYYRLITAIKHAKNYIYLTTPYFLPDHKLSLALNKAVKRGVDVRLLVPKRSNHQLVNRGSQTYYDYFLSHGIKIYRTPIMIHDKTGVIDDNWATAGSLNLDNVSLRYNLEGNLISTDRPFALQIKANFMADLSQSQQLTLEEWRKRSFLDQWLEMLIWPIRKLL